MNYEISGWQVSILDIVSIDRYVIVTIVNVRS